MTIMGQAHRPEHFPNLSSAAPEALDDEDEDFYAEEFDRGLSCSSTASTP